MELMVKQLKLITAGQMSESFKLEVISSRHNYQIDILTRDNQITIPKNQVTIIDASVREHGAHVFESQDKIIEIPGNEDSKQFSQIESMLTAIADYGVKRGECIFVIGGGSIQDVATITTSLYMRGIDWHYFPTTLASMMDSCIGGKSSINLGQRKNLIGNFHPPRYITINPSYVQTLPPIEISAGIAEGVKICFAESEKCANSFAEAIYEWRETGGMTGLILSIKKSLECKKYFIEIDEFDQNERQLLNYGHSFGHALESSSNYSIPHGIGVLLGMLSANSFAHGSIENNDLNRFLIYEFRESGFMNEVILLDRKELISALARDKKNSKDFQVLILPSEAGSLEKVRIPLTEQNLNKCADVAIETIRKIGGKVEVF